MFLVDLVYAFRTIPLHLSERRFFVAELTGEFYIFRRMAQGSRAAPLTFAVIAGHCSSELEELWAWQEKKPECRCMLTIH